MYVTLDLTPIVTLEIGTVITIPILYVRKLRFTEIKSFVQRHT